MKVTFASGEKLDLANAVVAGAIAMIAGLIVVPLVSLCTYRLEKKKGILDVDKIDKMFACFEGKVLVKKTEALGDAEIVEDGEESAKTND